MTMIANYHSHTTRCNHAKGTEEEFIRCAMDRGLKVFGFSDDALELDNYVGITGCEGRNRFYDFTIESGLAAHDDASDGEH